MTKLGGDLLIVLHFLRTFPEGGNYGQKEAENVLNTLNDFSDTMSQNKTVILEMFVRTNYQSPTDIKQLLSKVIKPYVIRKYGMYNLICFIRNT